MRTKASLSERWKKGRSNSRGLPIVTTYMLAVWCDLTDEPVVLIGCRCQPQKSRFLKSSACYQISPTAEAIKSAANGNSLQLPP